MTGDGDVGKSGPEGTASDSSDRISEEYLPAASAELSAMRQTTEEAADRIMTAVETIDALRDRMPDDVSEAIGEAVIEIFEACGFQDLTGQRIGRVHKTLDDVRADVVEGRKETVDRSSVTATTRDKSSKMKEKEVSQEISEEDLLNGPQLPGDAKNQDEIDALFDDLDR